MSGTFRKPIAWRKLGRVVTPRKGVWWMRSHAMLPTPDHVGGDCYKIYFSGRNDRNQSHIGWALIDLAEPHRILDFSGEPVLAPGGLGCFDDNGVSPSCVVTVKGRKYLYFIGWNPRSSVRMSLFGGLAISDDDGNTFERWSRAPIIERCKPDPFLNTAPFVNHDGGSWRMYYVSGVGWDDPDTPRYHIKTAVSDDGLEWRRDGRVCIDFASATETALARPYVLREDGVYRMWFAHKGDAYRLGYAESEDGVEWRRDDSLAGLTVFDSGWDSEMVEYAAVVSHNGAKFMFYNGNDYGRDGIGLAVAE